MIRDATGINEVMDGTSAKGEQLVGVREQQMAAGNNAIYDITNAAGVLFRKVCEDIVKCLQVLPQESVLYGLYTKALGEKSMALLNSFKELPMYNFGIRVVNEMGDNEKAYLEQNIQIALSQKEIDLEDAIAIRQLAQMNSQMQAQANSQVAQSASQGKMQEAQLASQLEMQKIQMETQAKAQLMEMEYQFKMQLEQVKQQVSGMSKQVEASNKRDLDIQKEDRKDDRVKKQAVEQSKLISQRQGQRGELEDEQPVDPFDAL